MKTCILLILMIIFSGAAFSQQEPAAAPDSDTTKNARVVEAACGQCQFGLAGSGCNLAVRFDGKAWYVSGTGIDDHGDPHAPDGFCNAIRKASVKGELVKDRFVVSYFKLNALATQEQEKKK